MCSRFTRSLYRHSFGRSVATFCHFYFLIPCFPLLKRILIRRTTNGARHHEVLSLGPRPWHVQSCRLSPRHRHRDHSHTYRNLPPGCIFWLRRKVLHNLIRAPNKLAHSISSGLPTIGNTIDSIYGTYSLQGCYDASAGGYVVTSVTTNTSLTLEGCAASCKGSSYLAVANGNLDPQ